MAEPTPEAIAMAMKWLDCGPKGAVPMARVLDAFAAEQVQRERAKRQRARKSYRDKACGAEDTADQQAMARENRGRSR